MTGPLGRLSVQIALGPVLVIALVGFAMFWSVDAGLQRRTEDRFSEQISRATMQLDERIKGDVQLRVVGASLLAGQSPLVAALQSNDASTAAQIAGTYLARTTAATGAASGVRVYGPGGTLVLRAEAAGNTAQRTVPPEVLSVLQTGRVAGSVRLDETMGLAVSGIAPAQNAEGRTIAAVEAITPLDRAFAHSAAKLVSTDVVVPTGGRVTASSEDDTPFDASSITDDVRTRTQTAPMRLTFGKQQYLSGLLTYRDAGGGAIGDVYVGIEQEKIDETVSATHGALQRTLVIAVLIAAAAAWAFGWLAVRPMRPLLAAAERLRHNDLESPVPASGPAELRQLGEAMEDMRLAIRQSRDALQSANRDLAMRISTSDASLSKVTQDLNVMQAVVSQLAGDAAGGLRGVAEEMLQLNWVNGAFIALATEHGGLSTAAAAGLAPGAAAAVLDAIEARLALTPESEFVIARTAADPDSVQLPAWFIGGLAVAPMLTPDGLAGVVCLTSAQPMSLTPQRRDLLRAITHEMTATLERSELADEVEENRRIAEAVLREMADGLIVVHHENICQICNPAASRLLGLTRAQIIGRPAEEWLPVRGAALDSAAPVRLGWITRGTLPAARGGGGASARGHGGPVPRRRPGARRSHPADPRPLGGSRSGAREARLRVDGRPRTTHAPHVDPHHHRPLAQPRRRRPEPDPAAHRRGAPPELGPPDVADQRPAGHVRAGLRPHADHPSSIDLVDVLDHAARTAQTAIEGHQHRLRVVAPDEVIVWADPARIEQVLSNLLSNAIKYTPPGGEIELRVEDTQPFVSVSVADNGIGIPPEEQGGLFEKFYRTSSGRRTTGGTGLGLAIARSIVDLHGGAIRCDSDGQHGTTFTFTLPRRPL